MPLWFDSGAVFSRLTFGRTALNNSSEFRMFFRKKEKSRLNRPLSTLVQSTLPLSKGTTLNSHTGDHSLIHCEEMFRHMPVLLQASQMWVQDEIFKHFSPVSKNRSVMNLEIGISTICISVLLFVVVQFVFTDYIVGQVAKKNQQHSRIAPVCSG